MRSGLTSSRSLLDLKIRAAYALRNHFNARTTAFLAPLSRYLNTLIPLPSETVRPNLNVKPGLGLGLGTRSLGGSAASSSTSLASQAQSSTHLKVVPPPPLLSASHSEPIPPSPSSKSSSPPSSRPSNKILSFDAWTSRENFSIVETTQK